MLDSVQVQAQPVQEEPKEVEPIVDERQEGYERLQRELDFLSAQLDQESASRQRAEEMIAQMVERESQLNSSLKEMVDKSYAAEEQQRQFVLEREQALAE